MIEIVIACIVVFWLVQLILTDDFFFAILITAVIVFIFIDIDIEKETVELKDKNGIEQSIDDARDIAIDAVEKVGEFTEDVEAAFENGKENVKANTVPGTVKIDLDSFNWPAEEYIDLSLRSSAAASLFSSDDNVVACTLDGNGCFSNYIIKVHSDRSRYICKAEEICYEAR